MMSTRRDLFPPHIADPLAMLQDKVAPFDGLQAKQLIEELGAPLETWFDDFDIKPLASASIAQVHTAKLKSNGRDVVLKVIRPDIRPQIDADIKLMYRVARIVAKALPEARRLKPMGSGTRIRENLCSMSWTCAVKRPMRFSCAATSKTAKSCMSLRC